MCFDTSVQGRTFLDLFTIDEVFRCRGRELSIGPWLIQPLFGRSFVMSQLSFGYGLTRVRDVVIHTSVEAKTSAKTRRGSVVVDASTPSSDVEVGSLLVDSTGAPIALPDVSTLRDVSRVSTQIDDALRSEDDPRSVALTTTRRRVSAIEINGEKCRPTQRFWSSFFHRFGIADNVFRYFDHAEVFQRIADRAPSDELRFCIERDEQGAASLLAVTNPQKPYIRHDQILDLVERFGGTDVSYSNGVVTSCHTPRSGDHEVPIGADGFKNRYVLEMPIDGYSNPKIYLSLLRLVCLNGAVGYSNVFRSELNAGKNVAHSVARALDAFDNNEGYQALRQRFSSAQASWASVRECVAAYKTLVKLRGATDVDLPEMIRGFHEITGDLVGLYGLANLDALTEKRQRILPARCRVYDLINFLSEMATHHLNAESARLLQFHIGAMISDEYDLEGTAEKNADFNDFFLVPPAARPLGAN